MKHLCRTLSSVATAAMLSACSWLPSMPGMHQAAVPAEPAGTPRAETVFAVTDNQRLIRFNAGQPGVVLQNTAITGLGVGETLRGIDFRVSRGVLYAFTSAGRLCTLDTSTGQLTQVGNKPLAWPLLGAHIGFDFNPAADRVRIVTEAGQNLRLHPDTGEMVDFDPAAPGVQSDLALGYVNGDVNAGMAPAIAGSAYTYNKDNDKLTTNYVIDIQLGLLAMQGSHESKVPPVSPNGGRVMTVGPLGVQGLKDAAFDISDLKNTPLAALRTDRTRLYEIDLKTGHATQIGTIADGGPLRGIAIEP